jgi:hypothetical protein
MYSIFVEVFGNYKDILDLCQVWDFITI